MFVLNVWFCRLKSESNCKKKARISWGYWFKKTLYYQVALLYMLARLITNVSQVGHMAPCAIRKFMFLLSKRMFMFVMCMKMHMACFIVSFVVSRSLKIRFHLPCEQ